MRFLRLLLLLFCFSPALLQAGELPRDVQRSLDSLIQSGLRAKAFPGASFVVGDRTGVLYEKAYGYHDYSASQPVKSTDLYDIASCTKVVSTTFVLMRLYDQGKVRMDQTLAELLPGFQDLPAGELTLQELLTHTSGLRQQMLYRQMVKAPEGKKLFNATRSEEHPYPLEKNLYMLREVELNPLYLSEEPCEGYRRIGESLYVNPAVDTLVRGRVSRSYNPASRGKYQYNDFNFYLLRLVCEEVSGRPLEALSAELYDELECAGIGYRPLEWAAADRIVPTEEDYLLRRGLLRGYAHDEIAALSNGVGGNAGIFATAGDVARFCEMIAGGGTFHGRTIIAPATVRLFTDSPLKSRGIYRGLGFDKREPQSDLGGDDCCGHTGFTGDIFWIDRDRGFYMVFLSNRVYPSRINNKLSSSGLRAKLWQVISINYSRVK